MTSNKQRNLRFIIFLNQWESSLFLRGIEPSSPNDQVTVDIAFTVMDAIYTFLQKKSQGEKLA